MRKRKLRIGVFLVLAVAASVITLTRAQWYHYFVQPTAIDDAADPQKEDHHHTESIKGLVLSEAAKSSLGLELGSIGLQDYWRNIPVPAEVMEEPGHCEQDVSSTVHGIVLKIYAFHGQTVKAGDPLFDVAPTSELLASSQSALLKSIQEIELVQAELKRISSVTESGGIPASRKIEKESELKRLDSQRLLQIQELLVRGLTNEQITEIIRTKTLIRKMTIRVPAGKSELDSPTGVREFESSSDGVEGKVADSPTLSNQDQEVSSVNATNAAVAKRRSRQGNDRHEHGTVYSIEQLNVHMGKLIQPGEELCHLARHTELLLVGRAFERESLLVTRAIEKNWPVKAVFEVSDDSPVVREGLSILYSDNVVEPDSRTVRFYIPLPNELVRDQPSANGLSYRSWRFKPGQRARVLLPVEHLVKQIVLPAEAVITEGSEAFVFRVNGKRLERVPVRLLHRDSREVVIRSDGIIAAGDIVAKNHAYQLQLALKNAQGRTGNSSHEGHDHASHEHAGHEH